MDDVITYAKEEVMKMGFTEAMLLGLPEITFTNSIWLEFGENTGTCYGCLVGAALYAVGERKNSGYSAIWKHWPWTKDLNLTVLCPFCPADNNDRIYDGSLPDIATHFAEHYKQGEALVEEIAEIFKKIEAQYNPQFQEEKLTESVEEHEYSCT
jgi:hypothetical protein